MPQPQGPTRKELIEEAKSLKIKHPVNIPKKELEKLIAAVSSLPAELPLELPAPPVETAATVDPESSETPADEPDGATVIKLPARAHRAPRRRLSDREQRPWDPTAGYG